MPGTSNETECLSVRDKPNKQEFRKSRRMRYRSENLPSRASKPATAYADSNTGEEENLWLKPVSLVRAKRGRVRRRKSGMRGPHRPIGGFGLVVIHWRRKWRDSTYTPNASPQQVQIRVREFATRSGHFSIQGCDQKNALAKEIVSGFSRDRRRAQFDRKVCICWRATIHLNRNLHAVSMGIKTRQDYGACRVCTHK